MSSEKNMMASVADAPRTAMQDSTPSQSRGEEVARPAHTPGPWRAEKHPLHDHEHRSELWTIIAGEPDDCCDAEIAQVIAYEAEANARLIAAAPDMLKALKAIQEWLLSDCPVKPERFWNEKFVKANNLTAEAIAKVEGRS